MTEKEFDELFEICCILSRYLHSKRKEILRNRRTYNLKFVKPTPQVLARKRLKKRKESHQDKEQ